MEKTNDVYGYDQVKNLVNDNYRERQEAKQYRMLYLDRQEPVKTKVVSKEKKSHALRNFLVASAVTLGLAAGSIGVVDMANHPEDYLTTHPDFDGTPTFSQIIDRTPENFGMGGR